MNILLLVLIESVFSTQYGSSCQSDYCFSCSDNLVCEQCVKGFELDKNNKCIEICGYGSEKCDQKCGNYGIEKEGECVYYFDDKKEENENQCKYGYAMSTSGCVETEIKGCKMYVEDENDCQECRNEYFWNGNECEKDEYKVNENECLSGYYFDGNKCEKIQIENCKRLDKDNENKCEECLMGYYFFGNECERIDIMNCIEMNRFEKKCTLCGKGFGLNSENTCETCSKSNCNQCSTVDICVECEENYHLVNGECLRNDEYCIKYEGESCIECDERSYLSGNECKQCTLSECGNIQNSDESCSHLCQQGTQGMKIPNSQNCLEEDEICYSCEIGYYLDTDYTCKPCDDFCDGKCRISSTNCYGFDSIPHCKKYDEYGGCIQCEDEYVFVGGRCNERMYGCKEYLQTEDYLMKDESSYKCHLCYKYDTSEEFYANDYGYCQMKQDENIECPEMYEKNENGECKMICDGENEDDSDESISNNHCICKANFDVDNSGRCMKSCETQDTNNAETARLKKDSFGLVCECPEHTFYNKGTCECEEGFELIGNKCTTKDNSAYSMMNIIIFIIISLSVF